MSLTAEAASQIPSALYSMQEADDVYFNMTRVTDENKQKWSELASWVHHRSSRPEGAAGFLSALKYYNNTSTEVWVAFASDKPAADANDVNQDSIEMFVTVTTSEHSSFTGHMGITRSGYFPQYKQHKNISTKLHAFAAKFMLEQHPEKLYEINVPTPIMQEIIIKKFEDKGLVNKVFIGDNITQPTSTSIEENRKYYEMLKQRVEELGDRAPDKIIRAMHERLMNIHLLEQKFAAEKGEKYLPIEIRGWDWDFVVKDEHNQIVQTITKEQQKDEFAWFFGPGFQFTNVRGFDNLQLLTCDLHALADLGELHGEIQLVGEAPGPSLAAVLDELAA
jgi:hypothetical protein